jgi:hypothetical protein
MVADLDIVRARSFVPQLGDVSVCAMVATKGEEFDVKDLLFEVLDVLTGTA